MIGAVVAVTAGCGQRPGPHPAGRGGPLVADLEYQALCDQLRHVVPRVDQLMALLAGRLIGHLDLKDTGYEPEVVALASSILGAGNVVVTTWKMPPSRRSSGRSRGSGPRCPWDAACGGCRATAGRPVRHSELFPLARIRACGADWVAVNYRLARLGVARRCHRNGIGIMVRTVDQDVLIDQFLSDQRIDVLITNRPGHAARRRSELGHDAAAALAGPPPRSSPSC
jgi:glycerophosphoryl diester phosphodiesterase